ncbi:class I SAM-dependent methyltransferase [Fodinicola acaciae]|uniref:class I SAM-dependent methyltransferase n=1 Tax=Fodinicola acaciae TaxID=2681555 RepID=UPI001C9E405D|nr:class I SAM-dependent methyltransferase [Fodinicola acaciae]
MTDVDSVDITSRRVAAGWDDAADGYERYFVPRFAPWLAARVRALGDDLPPGPVLVPCCGTFPELDVLLAAFGDREVVGIDLSAGMLRVAQRRIADRPGITLVHGDASAIDPHWSGRCAAVLSVFGLQQLPDPVRAMRSWTAALRQVAGFRSYFGRTSTNPTARSRA